MLINIDIIRDVINKEFEYKFNKEFEYYVYEKINKHYLFKLGIDIQLKTKQKLNFNIK